MSEPSQETRSPAAKMLLAMMRATMNIDQSELEQFGIIDEPQGYSPAWDKWNKDAPMFIVKLDDRELNALAALIKHKFPAAFGGKMTDIQQWGLKAANDVIGERPNHVDPIYWLDTRDNIARALTAAHARGHAEGVAQERERCAMVEDVQAKEHGMNNEYDDFGAARERMAERIAAAIRKGANHE